MSEIPYFPSNDTNISKMTTVTNGVFTIAQGNIIAPFQMVNISNEPFFSDKNTNEQIYVSRLPLFDNCYWFFDLNCQAQIDVSQRDEPFFFQNEAVTSQPVKASFYFFKTSAPLYLSRVNRQFKEYPFNFPSRCFHTGKITNVDYLDLTQQNVMLDSDFLVKDLNTADLALINQKRIQEEAGIMGIRGEIDVS